nr:uroporphyrinogen decarboxylase family protein [Candidatus Sigynarchaeum springense]
MNSRERVVKAIEFDKPDRVPYYGLTLASDVLPMTIITPRSWQPAPPYMPYVDRLELQFGTWRSKRKLPRGWIKTKHVAIDEWGVVWERNGSITSLGQVLDSPIKTWDDLERYQFPDPHEPSRYWLYFLAKMLGRKRYRLASIGNFFFERFHFLLGWERSMRAIVKSPKQASDLLDRLAEYYIAVADEWIKRGVDAIMTTEDLGGQNEPLISPAAYQRLFVPRLKRVIDYCHDHNVHFLMHSCGNIRELMPLIVGAGLDAFQFDGPDQTGIEYCSEHFGGKVAFMNVVDIQNVMPAIRGTPGRIMDYVKKMIYYLGRFDGGLVGTEYISRGVLKPVKNGFKIMHDAYKQFGNYPLDLERLGKDIPHSPANA